MPWTVTSPERWSTTTGERGGEWLTEHRASCTSNAPQARCLRSVVTLMLEWLLDHCRFTAVRGSCLSNTHRLFDSDNDGNQGVFAEAIRQQALNEHLAFYQAVEDALLDNVEKTGSDVCTPQALSLAFKRVSEGHAHGLCGACAGVKRCFCCRCVFGRCLMSVCMLKFQRRHIPTSILTR